MTDMTDMIRIRDISTDNRERCEQLCNLAFNRRFFNSNRKDSRARGRSGFECAVGIYYIAQRVVLVDLDFDAGTHRLEQSVRYIEG